MPATAVRRLWIVPYAGLLVSLAGASLLSAQPAERSASLNADRPVVSTSSMANAPSPVTRFMRQGVDSKKFTGEQTPVPLLQPAKRGNSSWYAPLASLALPGSGQALMRQQRSVAYLAAEAFLVLRAVRAHRDENAAKLQYQRLAAEVARAGFGADRPVGPWDYYEILETYQSSGAYDLNTGGKFTPETDIDTYNGTVWLGARLIFWDDPNQTPAESSAQYQRAIDRYKTLAMQGSFRFSWKDQSNVQNEYILSIADANRSQQRMVSTFGLLAATHLASAVDAYINVRLRKYGGAGLVGATTVRTDIQQTAIGGERGFGAAMTISVPVTIGSRTR